eukprot:CAMPEP_0119385824 /NCGR_PEP_ID=MMETSP1334-20130426/93088_1 /TAXON_ID=127549 /ORGANISM="Calcidiscus leptoporus, Strain RCC1130" /LENGTH=122 /DNA_ID=CAMNT_0007407197 /DNA_START=439 /DNA_END=803 /DNA_ORIENTATION=-
MSKSRLLKRAFPPEAARGSRLLFEAAEPTRRDGKHVSLHPEDEVVSRVKLVVVENVVEEVIGACVVPATNVVLLLLGQVGMSQPHATEAARRPAEHARGVGRPLVGGPPRRVGQQEDQVGAR